MNFTIAKQLHTFDFKYLDPPFTYFDGGCGCAFKCEMWMNFSTPLSRAMRAKRWAPSKFTASKVKFLQTCTCTTYHYFLFKIDWALMFYGNYCGKDSLMNDDIYSHLPPHVSMGRVYRLQLLSVSFLLCLGRLSLLPSMGQSFTATCQYGAAIQIAVTFCIISSLSRSTQPSTLRGTVKWVSAFGLSNNNKWRWWV